MKSELVEAIAQTARAVFQATACSIALVTEDGQNVVFTTASGGHEDTVEGLTMPISEGIVGWVASTGQAVAVKDLAHDPRFSQETSAKTGYVPNSILAAPIETDERLIGVIEILDRSESRPGADQDLQLLHLFAHSAGLAIDASKANDSRDETSQALSRLMKQGPAAKALATKILNDVADYTARSH